MPIVENNVFNLYGLTVFNFSFGVLLLVSL